MWLLEEYEEANEAKQKETPAAEEEWEEEWEEEEEEDGLSQVERRYRRQRRGKAKWRGNMSRPRRTNERLSVWSPSRTSWYQILCLVMEAQIELFNWPNSSKASASVRQLTYWRGRHFVARVELYQDTTFLMTITMAAFYLPSLLVGVYLVATTSHCL
ncbi:unnamed protein product [Protopolystoma xenopodis]|uniref:Uncharacterized protein n=1 Tax=Protopolystoma xenopodis TaxID=117903 RepID=A0A448XT70_9PLAT|nr:unnamed protein product [Protopolystoma xenopodis]